MNDGKMDDENIAAETPTATPQSSPVLSIDEFNELLAQNSIDLSNKCLKILPKLNGIYPHVKSINCSSNRFSFINNLKIFPNCEQIIASFNAIERFSCFLPLANVLKQLDVSHNSVSNSDCLPALTALVRLKASHNNLESLPLLDRLVNLTYLDISNNRLCDLPNLGKLHALKTLNLNSNGISTLVELHRTMPECLEDLNIGQNSITDLREAQHLSSLKKIRSITFANNPCVNAEGRSFCYRPYLYCCCLELLESIDGLELSETEIIKGEQLHANAKARTMKTHAQLCAYLEKECSYDCHDSFSTDDSRLMKILKKRREYTMSRENNDTTSEESAATTVSPYREWLTKSALSMPNHVKSNNYIVEQKENRAPPIDLSDFLSSIPTGTETTPPSSATSNISSSTVTLSTSSFPVKSHFPKKVQSRAIQAIRTPTNPKNTQKRGSSVVKSKTNLSSKNQLTRNIFSIQSSTRQKSSITKPLTEGIRTCCINSPESYGEVSFVRASKARIYSEREKEAAILIQSWWRGKKVRRIYHMSFLMMRIGRCEKLLKEKSDKIGKLESRLSQLEDDLEKAIAVNKHQTSCITEMQKSITEFAEACKEQQNFILSKLSPVPAQLEFIRKSETAVLLQWRNSLCLKEPTGYLIMVDGHPCGTVRGIQKKALVTELDPTKESVIRMQCLFDDLGGNLSECLVIPRYKQEIELQEAAPLEERIADTNTV